MVKYKIFVFQLSWLKYFYVFKRESEYRRKIRFLQIKSKSERSCCILLYGIERIKKISRKPTKVNEGSRTARSRKIRTHTPIVEQLQTILSIPINISTSK